MFSESSSICVTKKMILEINSQGLFDFFRVIFHGINRLDLPVNQRIDEKQRRDRRSGCVCYNRLILIADVRYRKDAFEKEE